MKAKVASRGGDSRLSVKKGKAEKDPNKPKRPPSAFFVFMEGFRREFKEQNPDNKKVSVVGKAGGEKWKSLTEEGKCSLRDGYLWDVLVGCHSHEAHVDAGRDGHQLWAEP